MAAHRARALHLVLLCGVLAGAGAATAAGECPLIIGVASTPGRPDLFKSFIGGEWRTSASGKTLKVLSPCNETMLYEVQVPAAPVPWAPTAPPARRRRAARRCSSRRRGLAAHADGLRPRARC